MSGLLHGDITQEVLGAAFEVHGLLGPGFLESIYEEAMAQELLQRQLQYERQLTIPICYKNKMIGQHRLDLLIAGCVVVELKAVQELADVHTAIALSYLKATDLPVALLLNFAKPSLEYRRVSRKTPAKPSA